MEKRRRPSRMFDVIIEGQKVLIGVVGISENSGTTFIATHLAKILGSFPVGVSYVEENFSENLENKHSVYDSFMLHREFRKKKVYDIYGANLKGESIADKLNIYKKVNWIIKIPDSVSGLKERNMCNFEYHTKLNYEEINGKYLIIDEPKNPEDMDILIGVIDPLPSKIGAGIDKFKQIKKIMGEKRERGIWLLNKNNLFVNRKWLENFLDIKIDKVQNLIPQELFYEEEYEDVYLDDKYLGELIELAKWILEENEMGRKRKKLLNL